MQIARLILGSRSPRRRELLELLIPPESIDVLPPRSSDELGFDGLTSWLDIARRLQQIAREKNDDVLSQLSSSSDSQLVLTADTIIVASDADGCYRVLGQPPDDDSWREVVRGWFCDLYAGRSHIAATSVCVTEVRTGRRLERIAQSHVWFREALFGDLGIGVIEQHHGDVAVFVLEAGQLAFGTEVEGNEGRRHAGNESFERGRAQDVAFAIAVAGGSGEEAGQCG